MVEIVDLSSYIIDASIVKCHFSQIIYSIVILFIDDEIVLSVSLLANDSRSVIFFSWICHASDIVLYSGNNTIQVFYTYG